MGDFFALPADADISFVTQMAQTLDDGLYSVIADVAGQVNAGESFLWGIFGILWNWLKGIFAALWNWIQDALHWLFHTFFPDLLRWINEIRAKITQWLQPLINWLKWERQWLNQFYTLILKPILNFIQALREILGIFRLLHMKWASVLDQYLADVEAEISARFLQMVQAVNMLANWVDYIVGPQGLFALPLLLLSQLQTLPQLWCAMVNSASIPIGAQTQQQQQQDSQSGLKSNAQQTCTLLSVGLTPDYQTDITAIGQLYQADGYTIWGK